ncbi:nucleotide sugar dehydrogenase [Bradyrhizobium sp. ARR65]|uniref:nucleotide sugar dehydrogenase n=1 Tax=Bradyrhizobium sp. ARR65 TaxID=1040989 RepID=UPI000466F411|nr:nucleotide sugar dehydrogenase [Bradyrhizobium sp. ARR65]
MRIVVCGLGYVGVTVAACMLRKGATVIGVDVNPQKVEIANEGHSPVKESGVDETFSRARAENRLTAATTLGSALADADVVVACVGTPSREDGSLELSYVSSVSEEIGTAVRQRSAKCRPLLCVFRSTMLPGTMETVVMPKLSAAAGEPAGQRYEPVYNPEFMRESTAITDYFNPPKIVVGERFPGAAQDLHGMYDGIDAPVFKVPFAVAEMAKYVDNYFHALKVSFANEIARLALTSAINPRDVIRIFLSDTKLNVSPYYLRPGNAFGGSCLPKDVRALSAFGKKHGLEVPLLQNVIASNTAHKSFIARLVLAHAPRGARILQMGLTFKPDTDDLRESPLVELAATLLERGYDLCLFEPDLKPEQLIGANLAFANAHLARLPELLVADFARAAARADLIVLGKAMPGVRLPSGKQFLNLYRL